LITSLNFEGTEWARATDPGCQIPDHFGRKSSAAPPGIEDGNQSRLDPDFPPSKKG